MEAPLSKQARVERLVLLGEDPATAQAKVNAEDALVRGALNKNTHILSADEHLAIRGSIEEMIKQMSKFSVLGLIGITMTFSVFRPWYTQLPALMRYSIVTLLLGGPGVAVFHLRKVAISRAVDDAMAKHWDELLAAAQSKDK